MPERADVAVIGGGIVGLAVARELTARGRTVTVLEREERVAAHQTGHSSGVVHAGISYAPGSLKARLCVEGGRLLEAFCSEHGVTFRRTGKVIVATDPRELPGLDELERRGRANGVEGLRRIGPEELRELEPHARGVAALHSPVTAVADFPAVARALARELDVRTGHGVERIDERAGDVVLHHARGELLAEEVVACAGLWADRLAPAEPDPRIVPFRGAYLRLRPEAAHLVRSLVYPVADPRLPFLGVHLTRTAAGEVLVGPTALLSPARDAYRLATWRPSDLRETLAWPGTWRMARRWWRTGLTELGLVARPRALARQAARYIPELRPEHLEPAWAGVRAQALARDGTLLDDFAFSRTPRTLHVRNAPSPAATSSLAIARHVADAFARRI